VVLECPFYRLANRHRRRVYPLPIMIINPGRFLTFWAETADL
jgi:hypothetical protein